MTVWSFSALNFVAAIPLAIWIYLFLARGNFWRVHEGQSQFEPPETRPRIVAIVPARNEAETIATVISSMAKQDYPGEFSILVVDDHSEDGTAALAQQAAESSGGAQRVKVLSAAPLAPEWTGKLWALHQGVAEASPSVPDYFWFTDADIEHAPDTLLRLVARAEKESLDLASLMVLLRANTIPERLLVPPFLYFFLMLYPPEWIADPKARTAGAAGGCVLVRRSALERIGGFTAIRGEVIDDCALAHAVKRGDGKIWMGLTRSSVSLRRYGTFSEIRDLIARTAFTQLQYSFLFLLGTLLGLFVTYLLPWVLFFAFPGEAWLPVDTTIALMTATFAVTVRFYGLSWPWALTLPFAAAFYGCATALSAVRYWLGRGGQWKGRSQAPQKT
jgi:hopene-associated glycosyltransferase HpnB